ncbi:MAG: TSUP family transporter [Bacteriovoracia bacterium]
MSIFLSGLLIGAVMGLTGSGGALVAIPLFMYVLSMGLKEATGFSLVAVILAALINLVSQYKRADAKTAALLIPFSIAGSYFSIPLKALTPDLVIVGLLALISMYSLWSVWSSTSVTTDVSEARPPRWVLTGIVGTGLGVLTTLTGLGGGVLLMPIFVGLFKLPAPMAVATSLVAVALSSIFSLGFQVQAGAALPSVEQFLWLSLGIVVVAQGLKVLTQKISQDTMALTRKIVFTFVVIFAMIKIIGESV